jgi:Gpi18-like mannosyltransferase
MSVGEHQKPAVALSRAGHWYLSLTFLFFLGFLVRVIFAPFTEHQFDVGTFKNMATLAYSFRINPLYYWSYGPIWLYIILGVYPFYLLVSLWQPSELLLNLIIKLPLIIGDLLLAYVLYLLSRKVTQDQRIAKKVAAAWLFNPLVIFVSSIHGMFDQLPALFTLLSLALLLNRKVTQSAVSLAVAFSLKLYAIILIPFLIFPLAKENRSKALKFLAVFVVSTFLMYSPYLIDTHTVGILISVLGIYSGFGKFLGYSVGLANFVPYAVLPSPLVFILTHQVFALLLPVLLVFLFYLWRKKQLFSFNINVMNRNIAIILLAYFLTYQFVHPQFIIWVLPSLLIAYSVLHQLRGYLYHALWLSIFSWYGFQGFQTFISTALIPAASLGEQTLSMSVPLLTYLADFVFVISLILCIASLLHWREQ